MDETTPLQGETRRCSPLDLFNPRRAAHKYFVLIFMCLLGIGSYFCYDTPGALQKQITQQLSLTTTEFTNLYSFYSWPNVILSFFGGFLIDRFFGIRLGTNIFSFFILIGQIIFATGVYLNSLPIMYMGRFTFGIGGESLQVAQNAYAVKWFKSRELNMVFGLQLSFSRIGSTINFNTMVPIYNWVNSFSTGSKAVGLAMFIAVITCVFSQVCAVILAYFDKRADRILEKDTKIETQKKVNLWDAKDFPLSFWLLCLICVTFYVGIFPFVAVGTLFFQRKFGFEAANASFINSIIYVISAAASPVIGFLVDKVGRNLSFVFVGVITTLVGHILLSLTFLNPWVGMVILGFSYSVIACGLWPMVSLVIPEHQLGTAYGIMQSAQNLGLAVITLFAGMIIDKKGYLFLELFFIEFLFLCLILTLVLFIVNTKVNGNLNMSSKNRQARFEKKEQETQKSINSEVNETD